MTTKLIPWIAGGLLLLTGACTDQQPSAGGSDGGTAGSGWTVPWPGAAGSSAQAGAGGRRGLPDFPGLPGRGGSGGSAAGTGGTGGSDDADAGTTTESTEGETETGSLVIGR